MGEGRNRGILDLQDLSESRLLLRLSWPVMLSLLVQGLYSLVDSVYLSRLGEAVLSATSLAFVMQNLATAFLAGIATGMNAVISRALGADDRTRARAAVWSGFLVQGVFVLAFMAFGAFGVPAYFARSTGSGEVAAHGVAYLRPCMLMIAVPALQISCERLLQSVGMTRYTLLSQGVGSAVNILLDPLLIFGGLGCPALGAAGAAYATIIGQLIAALLATWFSLSVNRLLFADVRGARVTPEMIREICRIGIPSATTGIAASAGNYCINRLLIGFSATSNAAFGIYAKLQAVALMPTQGFAAGLVTMFAFFYGKRDYRRMQRTVRCGLCFIGGWSLICAALFMGVPKLLLLPFHPTEQMLFVGVPAFRIIGSTYLVSGYMMVFNSYFQAVGRSMFSLIMSVARQILVRIPAAVLLARLHDVNLLWYCWPISEVVSDVVCIAAFIWVSRRIREELRGEPLRVKEEW